MGWISIWDNDSYLNYFNLPALIDKVWRRVSPLNTQCLEKLSEKELLSEKARLFDI